MKTDYINTILITFIINEMNRNDHIFPIIYYYNAYNNIIYSNNIIIFYIKYAYNIYNINII